MRPAPGAGTSPGTLRSVLDAFASGAVTVDDVAQRTGLDGDLARVAIDQLVALRLIATDNASTSCPPTACGGCSSPSGSGCATGGAARRGGLVMLTLSRRPDPAVPAAGG